MKNYSYLKSIVDEINQLHIKDPSFKEEVIDHYATLYEDLSKNVSPESALNQVINHIHEDNIHQLKNKNMKNYPLIVALTLAFLSIVTVLVFAHQDKIDNNKALVNSFDESARPFIDPPYGNPLKNIDISSGYGQREHPIKKVMKLHKGIDLKAPLGTPVFSVEKGTVTDCGYHDLNGFFIEIKHDESYTTRYHHLQKINVKNGQVIDKNQEIGAVGSSGLSVGPHLHYEIIKHGETIDPKHYLKV